MDIGKGIKFIRLASGLKQGKMAKMLGISQNYLSLLENNHAEPSISLLKKISKVFSIPASFLFLEEFMPIEGDSAEISEKYNHIRSLIYELQKLRITNSLQNQAN